MSETISVALTGGIGAIVVPWCAWVTVAIFKANQEIALVKQEIILLDEVKLVLEGIKLKL